MKYLSIILLYISIVLMVGCTGLQKDLGPEPEPFVQTITIVNDSPVAVVMNLKRIACEFKHPDGRIERRPDCPKACAEMQPGVEHTYDVTDAWTHTYPIQQDQASWYYVVTIEAHPRHLQDVYKFKPIYIAINIGVAGDLRVLLDTARIKEGEQGA